MIASKIVVDNLFKLFKRATNLVNVTLSLYGRLPLTLGWFLGPSLIFHLYQQGSVSATRNKADQVSYPGPDAQALSNCALNWVAVRPIILIGAMKEKTAILRKIIKKPLKTLGLYPPLWRRVVPFLRLWRSFNDRHSSIPSLCSHTTPLSPDPARRSCPLSAPLATRT